MSKLLDMSDGSEEGRTSRPAADRALSPSATEPVPVSAPDGVTIADAGAILAEILYDGWAAAPPDPEDTGDSNWSVVANRVPYIAKVYEPYGEQLARLIAAAPELLEALGEAYATLFYIFECSDDEQASRAAKETADKLEPAIAKAGGHD